MDIDTLRKAQGLIAEARVLVEAVMEDEEEGLEASEEGADMNPLEKKLDSLVRAMEKLAVADTDIETAIGG